MLSPFPEADDRQPLLNWPRQIPLDGEPPHMVELVQDYADWLASVNITIMPDIPPVQIKAR